MTHLADRRRAVCGIAALALVVVQAGMTRIARAVAGTAGTPGLRNVKDYGAAGTGLVDDAAALNAAARALQSGETLVIPAGTYLVDSAAWLIKGKSNIAIRGDGAATKIIVSGQTDNNSVKQDFHSTMVIDQCTVVEISDMAVESRGANFGNTDAYGSRKSGDDRAAAIIDCGGSALAVLRSSNVTLSQVMARRCGSVGVIYLSSCEQVVVRDCFANARSLGYAGFAVDNWVDSQLNAKRTYSFMNCSVEKEDATFSSKGGIVAEGDNGRPLTIVIDGGKFSDGASGRNAPTYGTGATLTDCDATVSNVTTENCYIGLRLNKRGGVNDLLRWQVSDCSLVNCKVAGVYLAVGSATGGGEYALENLTIQTNGSSVWRQSALDAVNVSTGIVHDGFMAGEVNVRGAKISGGEYGIYATDQSRFTIEGGNIEASTGGIALFGAGTNRISGMTIRTLAPGSTPILVNTANKAQTASRLSTLVVAGCTLESANGSAADVALRLTGNPRLFAATRITNNRVVHGSIVAPRGSASTYEVE